MVDVEGVVRRPQAPVEGCSQADVELHVTAVHCVRWVRAARSRASRALELTPRVPAVLPRSRAMLLPFEVTDAARSAAAVQAAAESGEQLATVSQVCAACSVPATPWCVAALLTRHAPCCCCALQDTRLDGRFIDLRTPANQAIFRVQSAVCQVR